MKYIWINPVAAGMYETEVLDEFLKRHGYQRFETAIDWLEIVREKYRKVVGTSDKVVIDMRCPKAAAMVREFENSRQLHFPEIQPILIHCGQEAGISEELLNAEKVITTPCQSLADVGNALKISNTVFVPWNTFLESLGDAPEGMMLKRSPIPLGFFQPLNLRCKSLSGEEEIRKFFKNPQLEDLQLIEMLYCKNGCHNGDGIKSTTEE